MHTTSHYEMRSTGRRLVTLVILTLALHPAFAFFQLAVYKALCHPPVTTSLFSSKVHRKIFQSILEQTIFPVNINLQLPLPNSLSFHNGITTRVLPVGSVEPSSSRELPPHCSLSPNDSSILKWILQQHDKQLIQQQRVLLLGKPYIQQRPRGQTWLSKSLEAPKQWCVV
jgi:hypothetical protein